MRELNEGMAADDDDYLSKPPAAAARDNDPVRAGVLTAGIDFWATAIKRLTLYAVAQHRVSGAPAMAYTERNTAAHKVLDVLRDQGVPESRVCLAPADRNPDASLNVELAARGGSRGHDGAGQANE